ncbi:hypothetical protein CEN39_22680 [Fischerella thermalis CCMEE 5201]|jgi:D-methionine transport system substrate-binding protein|nr:hypothetical protein CEN39_22680 [Fischerella thermalis CCMEE 5201]
MTIPERIYRLDIKRIFGNETKSRFSGGDRMNIKINSRFFFIAVTSFTATIFTSCSSPQNNGTQNTVTGSTATTAANTFASGTKEKYQGAVLAIP